MSFDHDFMWGMHGFGWLFWLALIAVLLFAVLARSGGRQRSQRESPHEVLRRRLASGEITAQDYEERKLLLDRGGPGGP
jgi:putative membrane protein